MYTSSSANDFFSAVHNPLMFAAAYHGFMQGLRRADEALRWATDIDTTWGERKATFIEIELIERISMRDAVGIGSDRFARLRKVVETVKLVKEIGDCFA